MSKLSDFINSITSLPERLDNLLGTEEDRANTAFDVMKIGGKAIGLDLAANNIERYETGMGDSVTLSRKQLGEYGTIRNAEKTNHDRLLNSLTKKGTLKRRLGRNNLEQVNFEDLKDNDRVILDDYYDVEKSEYNPIYFATDPDMDLGIGSFKMRSKSNLEFQKSGNKLLPYGYVEHTINDIYDFNPGNPYRLIATPMENAHRAQTYPVKASWKTYPFGVINIDDDKIDASGIHWDVTE